MFQKGRLIRLLYNFLFCVFFLFTAPFYFWKMWRRGSWQSGFGQRFGSYDAQIRRKLGERPTVWLHAVSVGEVNLCVPLLRRLQEQWTEYQFVVSTTTSTGMAELRKKAPDVIALYYPIDFGRVVRCALSAIRPQLIVLMEAEIWPNLIWQAQDRGIPVALANARLSQRSFRGYRRARLLFGRLFESLAAVGAQSEADAQRWTELGCDPQRVKVTGNLKFDALVTQAPGRVDAREMLRRLDVGSDARILVAGSTHPGEAEILATVFQRLKKTVPALFLIVVPRHMERSRLAEGELRGAGCTVAIRSKITADDRGSDCLLVDTTGELLDFYAVADVVFVGKSLRVGGGQNPLEPVGLGKPVIFGPRMGNFRDIVELLCRDNAAVRVSETDLHSELKSLLTEVDAVAALVEGGRRVLLKNRGTLDKTVQLLTSEGLKKAPETT